MPRGDKSKYTEKQKRQAKHIEEGYKRRGANTEVAARRAWATVNKAHGGGISDVPTRSIAFLRLCFAALRTGAPVKA